MDFIIDAIVEWLKGLLVDGIMGNLDGLFDNVNQSVGEIATQVGTTPADWNAGVFSMIRQISETAILPIAGVILTFVMTYELIQMLIERNNLHEVDTWMFFKWVFKTFVAVMILTNTFNIVLAVFDVSQHVIQQSAGIIQNGTEITPDVLDSLRTELEAMELGPLFGLWLQSFLIQLTMIALNIVIFVIVYTHPDGHNPSAQRLPPQRAEMLRYHKSRWYSHTKDQRCRMRRQYGQQSDWGWSGYCS